MMHRHLIPLSLLALAACGSGSSSPQPPVSAISISASPSASLVPGGMVQLTPRATTASGAEISSATFAWRSSDTAIATVSANGMVTGVAAGSATITATAGRVSGSTTLQIRAGGIVGSAGATVATGDGKVMLSFPANAVAAQTPVSIVPATDAAQNEHSVGASAYSFGPSGTQFAQPVAISLSYDTASLPPYTARSALRVAKLVGGQWEIVRDGATVDSTSSRVKAQLRSFSTYGVVRDPCAVMLLGTWASVTGDISASDCLYQVAGRRSDYYEFKLPANEMLVLQTQGGLDGIFGVKAATTNPTQGTVWDSDKIGGGLRIVGNGSSLQLFVSGRDSTRLGSYVVTRGTPPATHVCPSAGGIYTVLMPGASISDQVTDTNSCDVRVAYSPFPQAIGKPIYTHLYAVKLEGGKSYTITLEGIPASVQQYVTLSVFLGNSVAGQDFGGATVRTTRTVTVRPGATAYHVIEPSTGAPGPGGYTDWRRPGFPYTLRVSAGT